MGWWAGWGAAGTMMLGRLHGHVCAPVPVVAADATDAGTQRLEAALAAHAAAGHIPAVAVGIVKQGALVRHCVAGTRRLETGWAADEQSIFQIASISKTVTGVCAMRLVERGLLALDDDIAPLTERVGQGGFSVRNPRHPTAAITLRMLLSMSSSITDSAVYSNSYTAGDSQWSLARFCREYFAPDGSLFSASANYGEAEPGASFAYSNVGAGLVGFLVEAASGTTFAEFAEENVFGPLGMTSCADQPRSGSDSPLTRALLCRSSFLWAGLEAKGVDLDRVAMPYSWITSDDTAEGGYHKPHGFYGCPTVSDGFMRTTVGDLAQHLLVLVSRSSADCLDRLWPKQVQPLNPPLRVYCR